MELPVPNTDDKTILSFSTLHKLHHKKYFIDALLFRNDIVIFYDFFGT